MIWIVYESGRVPCAINILIIFRKQKIIKSSHSRMFTSWAVRPNIAMRYRNMQCTFIQDRRPTLFANSNFQRAFSRDMQILNVNLFCFRNWKFLNHTLSTDLKKQIKRLRLSGSRRTGNCDTLCEKAPRSDIVRPEEPPRRQFGMFKKFGIKQNLI